MELGEKMGVMNFLKDRLLYIIFYIISSFLVIVTMMLDLIIRKEPLSSGNILYAVLLSVFLLAIFLSIDYIKKRDFYRMLNQTLQHEANAELIYSFPDGIDQEHDLIKDLISKQQGSYENTLEKYKRNNKNQIDFKNRWIHQMKTPVSVIKLLLENEKDRATDFQTKKNYLSIEEEIEKLSHGLEMALYSLRLNDFELDFKVEEVSLVEVVRSVINENKNAFIVNSIYPKMEAHDELRITTDRKWIKFTLSQIINNSIKYTRVKESQNKTIQIKIFRGTDSTKITIQDNGVGIPGEDLTRVFNPFFTGKNGRRFSESTGMGLYLAKDICDKLGHGIEIAGEEGIGTKVTITFYDGKSIYNFEDH